MRYIFLSICLSLAVFPLADVQASDRSSLSEKYIAFALQGNLEPAKALFPQLDPIESSVSDLELARRFESRFVDRKEDLPPGSGDPVVDAVISAYRQYWSLALMGVLTLEEGKDFLEASLRRVLLESGGPEQAGSNDNVFALVGKTLDEKGLYHLDTTAPPLLDLFLWRKEESRNYRVKLTERTEQVRVTFMKDVLSTGWKEYATLGLVATTGWVEKRRLYCIESAYDRGSETFEVSYLKHESRHLADLEKFPSLPSSELEYRAKLTELAYATATVGSLLEDFTHKSARNPDSPHAYANYRVTRDIYEELYGQSFPEPETGWPGIDAHSVNAAARKLLQRNNELLQSGGA